MTEYDAEYVLPLRRRDRSGERELLRYVDWVSVRMDLTIVDGSDSTLFEALDAQLPAGVRHVAPARPGLNGKARGAVTGLDIARRERIVLADDDVRYDDGSLTDVLARLDRADLVRPQNVYARYPWHARWDTSRMLIGRTLGGDFGGTVGLRRSIIRRADGYRTDVLFENLELERTVRALGGRIDVAPDVFVSRTPPTVRHFVGQRVRQAYDGFAQPARLIVELAMGPVIVVAAARRAWRVLAAVCVLSVATAEAGRRRAAGTSAFPATSSLWAPLWVIERAAAAWIALALRLRGGVSYSGARIAVAATPPRALRLRLAAGQNALHD